MILRTIGQGGMGAVYQARDMRRGIICAIKEMSLTVVPLDERTQAIQNFRGEAKILSALNHPNLPTFTGLFTEGQRYFLVMEYIEGQTLEQLLEQNGPFPERRVLGWGRQLCDVLEYLHSQNPPIIFRDIKPGNIMLTHDGHIKLIDFGIARFFRETGARDTQMLGTPGFAPPEQYGKAQTDERSDIYSLAITLFQLLTNTLSEKGFGLKDVRSINPNISPNVARAIEKASSLSPEDRYDSIASFRRALLGVGTFFFENGSQATTPEELADLSAHYPEEAADYLFSGEFESWFHEIGDFDLARSTKQIRMSVNDPTAAIERFLQVVMGPGAHIRGATGTINLPTNSMTMPRARTTRSWLSRKPASSVIVEPVALDFGEVYPGMSAPLSLTISGDRGMLVQGTISSPDAWITLDQTAFDGMSTRVNVRINSMRLTGSTRYSGTILVKLDTTSADDAKEQMVVVKVRVEVLGNTMANGRSRAGQTWGIPSDDDDDTTLITTSSTRGPVMAPQQQRTKTTQGAPAPTTQVPAYNNEKYNEYRVKYGRPGGNSNATSAGWDPLQATPKQRTWLKRGITLFAAFMVASLPYTVIEQLLAPGKVSPLPPGVWFIVVLVCMVPAATIGALLVNWSTRWSGRETLNRLIAGLSSVLAVLGIMEFAWESTLQINAPGLQLFVLLLLAAIAAYFGTSPSVSNRILSTVRWGMRRRSLRQLTIGGTLVAGGILGFFLTTGSGIGLFTVLAVVFGMLVMGALALRVDSLIKQNVP